MRHRVVIIACLWSVACGGGGAPASSSSTSSSAPPPEASTSGAEAPAARVEEPPPPPEEPPPPPRGPGRLRVANWVSNQEVGGNIRVLDSSGAVVAEGSSGETFSVPAGTYRVVGVITDAALLIDTPTRESDDEATVSPGQETSARVTHPVARIRLRVTQRGRALNNWRAELRRQNGQGGMIEMRAADPHRPVSPGRYDAVIIAGSERFDVSNVIFQPGSTADVPVTIDE